MSQITFPHFTNMQPIAEDLQLIVDSLRTEVKNRLTVDGIFNPGIVGQQSDYLSYGSQENTIKIKPFIAYTQKGNRIEVESTFDKLSPQGTVIPITEDNIVNDYLNIPVWSGYSFDYANYLSDEQVFETRFSITKLGKGSILHGIKLRTTSKFLTDQGLNNVTVCIGTQSEPDKFLPETLVSTDDQSTDLSVMNLMYSIDDDNETDIYITFKSDNYALSELTNGVLKVFLCVANLSGYDNTNLNTVSGGFNLSTGTPVWYPSTTYYIVARYKEDESDFRKLEYKDSQGNIITTNPEAARIRTNYQFFALRKTGSIIDSSTLDDVKIGEVQTDSASKIYNISINGFNANNEPYTQYLTIPGFRLVKNINAEQIGDGTVSNTQFSYLNTLTDNIQTQLNTRAQLDGDNTFTGKNVFKGQIDADVKTVNGYTAYATPMANSLLVLDENGKIPASAISESTLNGIANVYTVSSGITTNGRSSYATANTGKTGVILNATADEPLIFNYPDGSTEKITTNTEITGLAANGYYYLIKEKNGNFIFLPTAGGTIATIPFVNTANTFVFDGEQGTVAKPAYYGEGAGAYNAFDGTITTGAQLGKVKYTYFNDQETFIGYPNPTEHSTFLQIEFPTAITPTAFAACFRIENEDVCTPKSWTFYGSNDGEDWTSATDLARATNDSWNENEIKTYPITYNAAFKFFRFSFNVSQTTINNYSVGEETTMQGITMPIKCYYFQIYATSTDTTNKKNITEGYTFPVSPSVGSYHLDISKKPFVGYKATGMSGTDAWTKVQFVKLGFVEMIDYESSVNRKLNIYPFCYNTFTISDDNTFPGEGNTNILSPNTPITFNHNLGVEPNIIDIKFQCIDDVNGYSAGDIVSNIWTKDTEGLRTVKSIISSDLLNTTIFPCALNDDFYVIDNDTSSATYRKLTTTDGTKWKAIFYCARGW